MESFTSTQVSSAEASPRLKPLDTKDLDTKGHDSDAESGYGSATSSISSLPQITLTPSHLDFLNKQLENLPPMDILRFAKVFFPNLYQTTAFGLTGLATVDMLDKLHRESPATSAPVDLIFLDTLYHFQETYELVDRVRERYPHSRVHVFKPEGFETAEQFEATYDKLYELSEEMYDWVVKVEPQSRAFSHLSVAAVLTGRRRSQGGQRDKIPVLEIDEERGGVIKINPLVTWSFSQVQAYIKENNVPYNALLDRGYKSVGDWHSTSPVAAGEDERAGRWKGRSKTECGIHNKKSRYAQFLEEAARKEQQQEAEAAAIVSDAEALVEEPAVIVEEQKRQVVELVPVPHAVVAETLSPAVDLAIPSLAMGASPAERAFSPLLLA